MRYPAHEAAPHHVPHVDWPALLQLQPAHGDPKLKVLQVERRHGFREPVPEATLWHEAIQWRLPALEPSVRPVAGARFLACWRGWRV